MPSTVLILGARGRFGLAAARAFANAGWRVLGQVRPGCDVPTTVATGSAPVFAQGDASGIEWLGLDLHDTAALARAAQGASVVVHALNPAYTNQAWQAQVGPMMEDAICVTRALGATLMVPGNIYNFGAGMPPVLREGTPQIAKTVKGQVRIAMEEQLRHSGVRGIVIRAGDFFGSGSGTWFDTVIVKNIRKGVVTYPGPRDVTTAWAYLPDLARTFVKVAEKRNILRTFEVFHFAGYAITAQQWVDAITPVARGQGWVRSGVPLKLGRLPWAVIRLGALVVPTWAGLMEMRYLWETHHCLANDKLTALIGPEPHTPLGLAAHTALADLGLLSSFSLRPSPSVVDSGVAACDLT